MKQIVKREPINPKQYNIQQINSIKDKYPKLRQASKAPTFALTYAGTYRTLMNNCGFDEATAKTIEKNYHDLYRESDIWVNSKIEQATKDGYVLVAFDLKIRTPLLKNANLRLLNYAQQEEKRTVGNALGQSWGLLNNRAMNAVLNRIDAAGLSEKVYPVAAIHDACYYMIKNDAQFLYEFNKIVVEEASWQDDIAIYDEQVKLSGELDLFYPDWANGKTIPNAESCEEMCKVLEN